MGRNKCHHIGRKKITKNRQNFSKECEISPPTKLVINVLLTGLDYSLSKVKKYSKKKTNTEHAASMSDSFLKN